MSNFPLSPKAVLPQTVLGPSQTTRPRVLEKWTFPSRFRFLSLVPFTPWSSALTLLKSRHHIFLFLNIKEFIVPYTTLTNSQTVLVLILNWSYFSEIEFKDGPIIMSSVSRIKGFFLKFQSPAIQASNYHLLFHPSPLYLHCLPIPSLRKTQPRALLVST